MVWYCIVLYDAVWYDMIMILCGYGMLWFGIVCYDAVWYGTVSYGNVWYDYDMIW